MECPPGIQEVGLGDVNREEDAVLLLESIYGTVQSARQYFKKAVRILKEIGFTGDEMDPCLFWRKSNKGTCYIALYVDDNLLIGDLAAIDEVIELLRSKGFILKVEDKLTDYLSCEIILSKDKKGMVRTTTSHCKFGKEVWRQSQESKDLQDSGNAKFEHDTQYGRITSNFT